MSDTAINLSIERFAVDSSNVKSIGYRSDLMILDIEFGNNKIYRYIEVPKEIYEQLQQSESKGSFIAKNIKNKFAISDVFVRAEVEIREINLTTIIS